MNVIGKLCEGRRRSYAMTLVTQFFSLILGLISFKLAAGLFGVTGFGEYAVVRRAVSIVTFPLLMGLGISIPRYTAAAGHDRVGAGAYVHFLAGWVIAIPTLMVFCVVAITFSRAFALLVFGDASYNYLIRYSIIVVIGLYFNTIIYGYMLGRLKLGAANFLQFMNAAIMPLMAVALSGGDVARSVVLLGVGSVSISLVGSWWAFRDVSLRLCSPHDLRRPIGEILSFGLPRVPGEFALFGLFAVPTLIVAHRSGVVDAGFVSFGLSLIQLAGSMFAAIGTLLLPIVSRLRAEGSSDKIRLLLSRVVWGSLVFGAVIVGGLETCLQSVVGLALDPKFAAAAVAVRWLLVGAVPYVIYVVLRNPLDALDIWPHNTINLGITLISETFLLVFLSNVMSPCVSILIALIIICILTIFSYIICVRKLSN